MKVAIVTATPFEIAPTIQWLETHFVSTEIGVFGLKELEVNVVVTGVGMVATAWQLSRYLSANKPDLLINAGIAGALDRSLQIGEVVHITEDFFADLGAEDKDGRLLDVFELGLVEENQFPYIEKKLFNPNATSANFLPAVKGITVNKAHGSAQSIEFLKAEHPDAQTESMEGAAVFYGCLVSEIRFLQIRSISNYVEPRNREAWNIALAIQNLNSCLIEIIQSL
ncbi:MAG: futalosine hydrolase [Saprospiraceae bacterium]|nr:futalosine hydrolase [Saprospiraceae bacterium]